MFQSSKVCRGCNVEKSLSDFPKNRHYGSGLDAQCKQCRNAKNKKYREANSETFNAQRRKYLSKKSVQIKAKRKPGDRLKKRQYDQVYRQEKADVIRGYKKEWEAKNKNNPLLKIKRNLRRRISHVLGGNYKTNRTFDLIGCSPAQFKAHIESQFTQGMTWDNYGATGWHIDHIKPCFTFDLSNPDQQKECFHYTNQRPLWAIDNLSRPRRQFKQGISVASTF
jgi:hypothetical protein